MGKLFQFNYTEKALPTCEMPRAATINPRVKKYYTYCNMIKRHYEKVIIACCFAFVFVNIGMTSTAFSVHQPYLVAMDGIGDTGGALVLSVRTIVSLLVMLAVDRYYQLLGVRRGVALACLFTAIGFFVYSFATSLPQFLLGAVSAGMGYGLGGLVAMTLLANRWYKEGMGAALGFATMGSGIASIVMPLIVVTLIEAHSLSTAFFVEGIIALVAAIAMLALLRNQPSDMGLEPYAGKAGAKKQSYPRPQLREAPQHERLLFLFAMVLVGAYCSGGMVYISVLTTSVGFDAVFAAAVLSVAGAALAISKFGTGILFDLIGIVHGSLVVFAIGAVGFTLCLFLSSHNPVLMVVAAIFLGAGFSHGSVGISAWSLDTAPKDKVAFHVKNCQVCFTLGSVFTNTLPGIVKDLTGSYVVSYMGMFAMMLVCAFIVLRYYRVFAVK